MEPKTCPTESLLLADLLSISVIFTSTIKPLVFYGHYFMQFKVVLTDLIYGNLKELCRGTSEIRVSWYIYTKCDRNRDRYRNQVESIASNRKVHTGPRQEQGQGPTVSYGANPCTSPVAFSWETS